jgi:HD-GYP domain-containing protein (c-di-GMP phosphodiesterase class II)
MARQKKYDPAQCRFCRNEIVLALISALEYREKLTSGHSEKVTLYVMKIAKKMGMKGKAYEDLRYASLLHDIGKIGISTDILCKQAPLSKSDMKEMTTHPAIAKSILSPVSGLENILPIILHHHEHFDGKGYPDGLKGEEIPLGARIILVADTYETMTNQRLYRHTVSKEIAVRELIKEKGKQLDPRIVDVFVGLLKKGVA